MLNIYFHQYSLPIGLIVRSSTNENQTRKEFKCRPLILGILTEYNEIIPQTFCWIIDTIPEVSGKTIG